LGSYVTFGRTSSTIFCVLFLWDTDLIDVHRFFVWFFLPVPCKGMRSVVLFYTATFGRETIFGFFRRERMGASSPTSTNTTLLLSWGVCLSIKLVYPPSRRSSRITSASGGNASPKWGVTGHLCSSVFYLGFLGHRFSGLLCMPWATQILFWFFICVHLCSSVSYLRGNGTQICNHGLPQACTSKMALRAAH